MQDTKLIKVKLINTNVISVKLESVKSEVIKSNNNKFSNIKSDKELSAHSIYRARKKRLNKISNISKIYELINDLNRTKSY